MKDQGYKAEVFSVAASEKAWYTLEVDLFPGKIMVISF